MDSGTPTPWYERRAWVLVFVLAALMALFGIFILFSAVDSNDFENETGIVWSEFSASTPTVADYLNREARLLAAATLGFGLFAAGLAATLLRQGNRTAWALLWVFPGVLGLIAVVFFANGAGALGGFYVTAAAVAVIGMAAAFRALRAR